MKINKHNLKQIIKEVLAEAIPGMEGDWEAGFKEKDKERREKQRRARLQALKPGEEGEPAPARGAVEPGGLFKKVLPLPFSAQVRDAEGQLDAGSASEYAADPTFKGNILNQLNSAIEDSIKTFQGVDIIKIDEEELTDLQIDAGCMDLGAACAASVGKLKSADFVFEMKNTRDESEGGRPSGLHVRLINVADGQVIYENNVDTNDPSAVAGVVKQETYKAFKKMPAAKAAAETSDEAETAETEAPAAGEASIPEYADTGAFYAAKEAPDVFKVEDKYYVYSSTGGEDGDGGWVLASEDEAKKAFAAEQAKEPAAKEPAAAAKPTEKAPVPMPTTVPQRARAAAAEAAAKAAQAKAAVAPIEYSYEGEAEATAAAKRRKAKTPAAAPAAAPAPPAAAAAPAAAPAAASASRWKKGKAGGLVPKKPTRKTYSSPQEFSADQQKPNYATIGNKTYYFDPKQRKYVEAPEAPEFEAFEEQINKGNIMKITKSRLKQIIKEEFRTAILEEEDPVVNLLAALRAELEQAQKALGRGSVADAQSFISDIAMTLEEIELELNIVVPGRGEMPIGPGELG